MSEYPPNQVSMVRGFNNANLQSQCNPLQSDGSRRALSSLQTGRTLRISFSQKNPPYLSVRCSSEKMLVCVTDCFLKEYMPGWKTKIYFLAYDVITLCKLD